MTVSRVLLSDGTEIDANTATCEGCGEALDGHSCGTSVTITRSGKGTARKRPEDKEPCPHCGMPMHFNYGATAVNGTCIVMQWAVDQGHVTDPVHQKAPILTLELMGEISAWAKTLATPLTYGAMLTAAGGSGTYAGGRPKTGRKKKAIAAAPGTQIQDMAEDEDLVVSDEENDEPTLATPVPARLAGKRRKRGRPAKASTAPVPTSPVTEDDEDDQEYEEAPTTAPMTPPTTAPMPSSAPTPAPESEPAMPSLEERRAARQERRRAMLAGR